MSICRRPLLGRLVLLPSSLPAFAQSAHTPPPLLVFPEEEYATNPALPFEIRFDKRGPKVVLWANDANGVQTERMYKPIPFFLSSRGYGMFVHTAAPAIFDLGGSDHGSNALLLGDDELDLFVFLGSPKQVLDEYTTLTGKAAMPPRWSFGL